jgi:RNA polymerase sigma-70 factor (ECF subfamily)
MNASTAIALPGGAPVQALDELSIDLVFESLVETHGRRLRGYIGVLVGEDAADDCLQETLLQVFMHLSKHKPVNSQWLYRVARSRAIDRLRHQKIRRESDAGLDTVAGPAGGRNNPAIVVRETMLKLPVPERELLYLSIVDRRSSDEIGEMLGLRAGTVRVRLFRARERFRRLYEAPE